MSTNPTLANGEIGFITDQCRLVVGKDEVNFSGLWYSDSCVIPQTGITAGVGGGTINAFRFVNIGGSETIVAGEASLNLIAGNGISLMVHLEPTVSFAVSGLTSSDITDFTQQLQEQ